MSRVILYIAASLDGYIATPDGGVEWLAGYEDALAGFDDFLAGIGAGAMGRATYEYATTHTWQFKGLPVGVLTSQPLADPPPGAFAHPGPATDLVSTLAKRTDKDIWLLGGGRTIRAFLDFNLVDEMRIFIVPTLLGDGVALFPRADADVRTLRLTETQSFPSGVVELRYERPVR